MEECEMTVLVSQFVSSVLICSALLGLRITNTMLDEASISGAECT